MFLSLGVCYLYELKASFIHYCENANISVQLITQVREKEVMCQSGKYDIVLFQIYSDTVLLKKIYQFKWLSDRERVEQREGDFSSVGLLPKCQQETEPGQVKAKSSI